MCGPLFVGCGSRFFARVKTVCLLRNGKFREADTFVSFFGSFDFADEVEATTRDNRLCLLVALNRKKIDSHRKFGRNKRCDCGIVLGDCSFFGTHLQDISLVNRCRGIRFAPVVHGNFEILRDFVRRILFEKRKNFVCGKPGIEPAHDRLSVDFKNRSSVKLNEFHKIHERDKIFQGKPGHQRDIEARVYAQDFWSLFKFFLIENCT